MSRIPHRWFSALLAGVFALTLSGIGPADTVAADNGYCMELDNRGEAGSPPACGADPDGDLLAGTAIPPIVRPPGPASPRPVLSRRAAGTHLGHWPHAPPP